MFIYIKVYIPHKNSIFLIDFCQENTIIIKYREFRGEVWQMDGKAVKAILGKNVKFLRNQKGLTQAVLAEKANISIIFLSSIERGTKYPKAETLASIANVLKVEIFELFKGELVPSDSKEMVEHLSLEITDKLNTALGEIFAQYISKN